MSTTSEFSSFTEIEQIYQPDKNKSSNIMTVYQKTNLIGLRLEQLAMGAPSLLDDDDLQKCENIHQVAEKELELKLLPYMVQRNLGNNTKEVWKIRDMFIP